MCRHFFILVDEVKKFIDMMVLHNMNRLHWHITDDQGWRIEIKKYPELTTVSSRRTETVIGHNSGKYDGKPYGGFYTQEQAREIVDYAAKRYITVIPEARFAGTYAGGIGRVSVFGVYRRSVRSVENVGSVRRSALCRERQRVDFYR